MADEHRALAEIAERWARPSAADPLVRRALEDAGAVSCETLRAQADLGWLTVDDSSIVALAGLVEVLGRWLVPGPFITTAIVCAVLRRWASPELDDDLVALLETGTCPAGLALHAGSLSVATSDRGTVLEGSCRPIIAGGIPDLVLVPAKDGTGLSWFIIHATDTALKEIPAFDPTRLLYELRLDRTVLSPSRQVDAPEGAIRALSTVLLAAESVGGAERCMELAAEHARSREQFGGAIGRFQAVKHRCADMLVAVQEAAACAWDAARAIDDDDDDAQLATAVAGAIAPSAFVKCARGLVQVLGACGFAWEHDAHLYLRRATATQQLLGRPSRWHRQVASEVQAGRRGALDVPIPPPSERLRGELEEAIASIVARPDEERLQGLLELGLLAPHLEPPWGRGADAAEQLIIDRALAAAGMSVPALLVGTWVVETIAAHGTPEQRARWLPSTLLGRLLWCQLFSEPGAGSDLSAVRTTAVPVAEGWVLNGQKTWVSLAAEAELGLCLARTEPNVGNHDGLTMFVVEMEAAGVDVRPIREITGGALFNDVFFSDVLLPSSAVVGPCGAGWRVARTTLGSERVAMGDLMSYGRNIEELVELVASGPAADDEAQVRLGAVLAESHALRVLAARAVIKALNGEAAFEESSVRKVASAELDQRIIELAVELHDEQSAVAEGDAGPWLDKYLFSRAMTIAGGTSEIQRNIIGERLLGLPKDPVT